MTMIKKYIEDKDGNQVLPITHFSAVKDSDGNTLEDVLYTESTYDPTTYSGMGRKVLQKNMVGGVNTLTQNMMPVATGGNTIYIIRYDFTLGEDITVPANCVLEFDGGSISGNGTGKNTITGTSTQIIAQDVAIFKDGIIIAGTWACPRIVSEWFSDIVSTNRVKQLINLSSDTIYNEIVINKDCKVASFTEQDEIINVKSNTSLYISGSVEILPNAYTSYIIINIKNKNNVIVCGGIIIGDKDTHLGSDGEWGTCLNIENSKNVEVKQMSLKDAWGDCIYISESYLINIHDCLLDNGRRQGITVVSGENIEINNCSITNIGGTLPGAAVDIEGNAGSSIARNIKISNTSAFDCVAGFIIDGINREASDITIDTCTVIDSDGTHSQGISFGALTSRNVLFNNCNVYNVNYRPFLIQSANHITVENSTVSSENTEMGLFLNGNDEVSIINSNFNLNNSPLLRAGSSAVFKNCTISCGKIYTNIPQAANTLVSWYDCNISTYGFILQQGNENIKVVDCIINAKNTNPNHIFQISTTNAIVNVQGTTIIAAHTVGNFFLSSSKSECVVKECKLISKVNDLVTGFYFQGENFKALNNAFDGNFTYYTKSNAAQKNIAKESNFSQGGTTANRPVLSNNIAQIGYQYFDTSLSPKRPIYWTGSAWVDASGTPV